MSPERSLSTTYTFRSNNSYISRFLIEVVFLIFQKEPMCGEMEDTRRLICFKPGLKEGGIYCVKEKKERERAAGS